MASILVVDDSAYFRLKLKVVLENLEHHVIGEASDGQRAVQMYQQLKPDIVTMDISMPNMSGIEAVKEILSFDEKARIVMVSAMGQKHHVLEALKLGAIHFIVKPMQEETVKNVIDKVL